jgi:hypothetical protein
MIGDRADPAISPSSSVRNTLPGEPSTSERSGSSCPRDQRVGADQAVAAYPGAVEITL